jgi:hypothetical protein
MSKTSAPQKSKSSTNFDPFQDEDDKNDGKEDLIDQHDEDTSSKPTSRSLIDLLEIPSDHFESCTDRSRLQLP